MPAHRARPAGAASSIPTPRSSTPRGRSARLRRPLKARVPSTRPAAGLDHRAGKCTFEVLIDEFELAGDLALARLAKVVRAADIDGELHTDPGGPGLLAIGLGGLDVEADDHRLLDRASFV